jgi:hypothetical protein
MELLIIGLVLVILAGTLAQSAASGTSGGGSAPPPAGNSTSDGDNVPAPQGSMMANMITNDPASWPSGDIIWTICQAIASAEGANKAGSAPDRFNNPGDISDGASVYGFAALDSKITKFPDKGTGWQWLYNKVQNIQNGTSKVYSPNMTWIEIGGHWAKDPNWPYNLAYFLGVDPNSKFSDFAG